MIFKRVGEGRPYPDHGLSGRQWAAVRPEEIPLSELTTTRRELDLDVLLADDSTYFGDLFAHVVRWNGELYLEEGLHRALRAALGGTGDATLLARVFDLDAGPADVAEGAAQGGPTRP